MGHPLDSHGEHLPQDLLRSPGVPEGLAPAVPTMSSQARRASAPYAAKTRGYYRNLSATSVGLEMAIAIVLSLFGGMWLDGRFGTTPWLMLVCLGFGFTAGMRGVWRHVAAADRAAKESES